MTFSSALERCEIPFFTAESISAKVWPDSWSGWKHGSQPKLVSPRGTTISPGQIPWNEKRRLLLIFLGLNLPGRVRAPAFRPPLRQTYTLLLPIYRLNRFQPFFKTVSYQSRWAFDEDPQAWVPSKTTWYRPLAALPRHWNTRPYLQQSLVHLFFLLSSNVPKRTCISLALLLPLIPKRKIEQRSGCYFLPGTREGQCWLDQ